MEDGRSVKGGIWPLILEDILDRISFLGIAAGLFF
jgi:hypothetical protein